MPINPVKAAEDYLPEVSDEEAWDLARCQERRFDEPTPSQLERRGLTLQKPDLNDKARRPFAQAEFWSAHTVEKNTVAAKLREGGMSDLADKLEACHSEWTVVICQDCGKRREFPNRCDSPLCPECMPRIGWERSEALEWWTSRVTEPKFVTLTVRNIPDLTAAHVDEFRSWWTRLRRRKFASNWRGGFYTLEVTHHAKGWHLHLHALIDAVWIDANELSRQWAQVSGYAGRIVHVKDARPKDYLRRVKAYVVKGSDLAAWTPDLVCVFARAFSGVRTFGVFGRLYGQRTEFREWIDSLKLARPKCPCGSCNVRYYTEAEAALVDLDPDPTHEPRPPKPDYHQPSLMDCHTPPHEVGA